MRKGLTGQGGDQFLCLAGKNRPLATRAGHDLGMGGTDAELARPVETHFSLRFRSPAWFAFLAST